MENRIKSGVSGLDDVLGGGLFRGQTYGITGGPGSGKSILSIEFLVRGAAQGEKGLYVTSEGSTDKLIMQMPFQDVQGRINSGDIVVFSTRPLPGEVSAETDKFDIPGLTYMIKHYVKNSGIKRVVFDSVDAFVQQHDSRKPLRRELNNLIDMLESFGCTTLLVFENGNQEMFMDFMVDGVIELGRLETKHEVTRYIQVKKLRGTRHDMNKRALEIQDCGVIISNMKPFCDE